MVYPVRSFPACAVVAVIATVVNAPSEAVRLPASEGHGFQVVSRCNFPAYIRQGDLLTGGSA
jgi:hypothetical protein